jgi:hypothetical protein
MYNLNKEFLFKSNLFYKQELLITPNTMNSPNSPMIHFRRPNRHYESV